MLPHGRWTIRQDRKAPENGYIHLLYTSRAFEWIPVRKVFLDTILMLELDHLLPRLDGVRFGWKHLPSVADKLYRPHAVFCDFSVANLDADVDTCICRYNRFKKFCDNGTVTENCEIRGAQDLHVRTTDIDFFANKKLRDTIACGLNHIPLQATSFTEVIVEMGKAWDRFAYICDIEPGMADKGRKYITELVLSLLQNGAKNIRKGRRSEAGIWSGPAKNEVSFLLDHFYFSGLDKAANNICVICIHHIRLQALTRLQSQDFQHLDIGIVEVNTQILIQLEKLLPEIEFCAAELPYIMATYKVHKTKYRWITNAAFSIFSCPASIITQALLTVMASLKVWAKQKADTLSSLFDVNTNLFWVIDSSFELALDLPVKLHCLYIADITRCYEAIPLAGDDNLLDALTYAIRLAFRFQRKKDGAPVNLWVHINTASGKADSCCWKAYRPRNSNWIEIGMDRLIEIQSWLIGSCLVRLGDQVWRQVQGIPMGFSCSPLWCNLYFVAYEFRFILRMARLQQHASLGLFRHSYRYMDDLCMLNNTEVHRFLDPSAVRSDDNPFWIYPLNVVSLQPEMNGCFRGLQSLGTSGNFLNIALEVSNCDTGEFTTAKYDKRRSLPFKFQQYIHLASNRPVQQAYNIAVSQVLPILYVSSSSELALKEIWRLLETLHGNGFDLGRLHNTVIRFCTTGSFPGLRFPISSLCEDLIKTGKDFHDLQKKNDTISKRKYSR